VLFFERARWPVAVLAWHPFEAGIRNDDRLGRGRQPLVAHVGEQLALLVLSDGTAEVRAEPDVGQLGGSLVERVDRRHLRFGSYRRPPPVSSLFVALKEISGISPLRNITWNSICSSPSFSAPPTTASSWARARTYG